MQELGRVFGVGDSGDYFICSYPLSARSAQQWGAHCVWKSGIAKVDGKTSLGGSREAGGGGGVGKGLALGGSGCDVPRGWAR